MPRPAGLWWAFQFPQTPSDPMTVLLVPIAISYQKAYTIARLNIKLFTGTAWNYDHTVI